MSWLWAAGRTRSDKGHLRCCHFTEHGWGWRRQDRQGFIVPDRSGNVFCDQHGLHCQLAKCPKTYWNMWDHVSNEQSAGGKQWTKAAVFVRSNHQHECAVSLQLDQFSALLIASQRQKWMSRALSNMIATWLNPARKNVVERSGH